MSMSNNIFLYRRSTYALFMGCYNMSKNEKGKSINLEITILQGIDIFLTGNYQVSFFLFQL
jgi:hypothetical protein